MKYVGPERRIHKVYVTRNSEYHVRRNRCVGVRDRSSDRWSDGHVALGKQLVGSVPPNRVAPILSREPEPGDRLCFGDMEVVTSPVRDMRRPPKAVVLTYPVEQTA